MLRLLLVTFDPPENVGGVEGRARYYTECLTRDGHFVELVSVSASSTQSADLAFHSGSKVLLHLPSSLGSMPKALRTLIWEISRNSIDSIFLLSGGLSILGCFLLLYAKARKMRTVIFVYGKDILTIRTRGLLSRLPLLLAPRIARRIAANSRFTSSLLPKPLSHKIELLYPAVNPRLLVQRSPPASGSAARVILFVGRLVERKGVDELMRAFNTVAQKVDRVKLEIVGEGPDMSRLLELRETFPCKQAIHFAGKLRGAELRAKYEECEVFAMPSRTMEGDVEGFGTVFLEAALFAKPCIGTYSGGIPEAIVEGETGLLVPEGDPSSLAAALLKLLEDRQLALEMGKKGQERVLSQFTWDQSTRSLIQIIEKA